MINNEFHCAFQEVVNSKELNELETICNKFNVTMKSIHKIKDKYRVVDYGDNLYCLKKTKKGKKRIVNSYNLTTQLYNHGFFNIPWYIATARGNIYIGRKDKVFSMVQWIYGENEHFKDINDTIEFSKLLGLFQNTCERINLSSYKLPCTTKDWPRLYKNSIIDIEKYKDIIENKILKTDFDNFYYEQLDNELAMALNCLKILNVSPFYNIKNQCERKKIICYNNIGSKDIKKYNNNIYLVDIDNISIDLRIMDLQRFIRYIMNKKEYKWDFSVAKNIIDSYTMYNPLSKEEITMILSFICFPYDFWKIGRKRYIRHKNYTEEKYMRKLDKIISYKEAKEKFFYEYINYANSLNKM